VRMPVALGDFHPGDLASESSPVPYPHQHLPGNLLRVGAQFARVAHLHAEALAASTMVVTISPPSAVPITSCSSPTARPVAASCSRSVSMLSNSAGDALGEASVPGTVFTHASICLASFSSSSRFVPKT